MGVCYFSENLRIGFCFLIIYNGFFFFFVIGTEELVDFGGDVE